MPILIIPVLVVNLVLLQRRANRYVIDVLVVMRCLWRDFSTKFYIALLILIVTYANRTVIAILFKNNLNLIDSLLLLFVSLSQAF